MNNSLLLNYLEESAIKYKNKEAFVDENSSITFEETKFLSMGISNEIINTIGYKNNSPILVFLPKSVQAIVSMLGVVYSGNFYTPTSIDFPEEKIKSITRVLKPILIVTDSKNMQKLLNIGIKKEQCICYDKIDFTKDIYTLKTNTKNAIDTDLVYVYFTSGSTGVPKGVTINHRNVMDYIDSACDFLPIDDTTIFGNQSALHFDITTQDVYATLKMGSTLIIIPERLFAFPKKLLEFLQEKSINFLFWVPSVFINVCLFKALDGIMLDKIKSIMFAGEVLPVKYFKEWEKHLPNLEFAVNAYGPTEITVDCAYYKVENFDGDEFPIGSATKNTRLLLLDKNNKLITEANKIGELCVAGTSVSPGYYQNPEKSKEVFVQNPLHNDFRDIIYRTGDLAMYDEDNLLLFCGRIDNQIKHLGYRIELGEIETAALGLEEVDNCMAFYNEDKRQITLVYSSTKDSLENKDVKLALTKLLPKYMVPTKYYKVNVLPTTEIGKIDRVLIKNKYS